MELTHIIAFNLTLLAAILSPGPAMLYFIRTTLAEGRRAGLFTVFGLGTMAALWTAMALLGLNALFALVPWAYIVIKTAGALYLIWIAVQTWKHARDPLGQPPRPAAKAFLGGVLVNLANPKSVLFAAAVLIVIFPPDLSGTEKAAVVLNHLVVEWLVGAGLVLLLSTQTVSQRYLRLKAGLDRFAALVLGALGLRLLLER